MRARGYTLVELMVAMSIALIGIAAGVTLMVGTQRWFQGGVEDREMQETARVALGEISSSLQLAGYGMEPAMTFDLGVLAGTVMDRLPPPLRPLARFGGYGCGGPGLYGECPARDGTDRPDELVFYARDKAWQREVVTDVARNRITLGLSSSGRAPGLLPGQVLQVMCYGASNQWIWAYVTVRSSDERNLADVIVNLEVPPGQPYDFPFQNDVLLEPCFTTASLVRVFKIDRYRFHVQAVDAAGQVQPWGTAGARPYLMLDQGLRGADGNPVDQVVSPDVEDLQVAYVFPLAPVPAQQVLGATPGTAVLADTAGVDENVFNLRPEDPFVVPTFGTPPGQIDLARTSHHPANIRAVRVSLTVRSSQQDPQLGSWVVPQTLNREERMVWDGFRRIVVESTIYVQNMEARAPVFPFVDPTGATGNHGGA